MFVVLEFEIKISMYSIDSLVSPYTKIRLVSTAFTEFQKYVSAVYLHNSLFYYLDLHSLFVCYFCRNWNLYPIILLSSVFLDSCYCMTTLYNYILQMFLFIGKLECIFLVHFFCSGRCKYMNRFVLSVFPYFLCIFYVFVKMKYCHNRK